jgi:acyl carrier protein
MREANLVAEVTKIVRTIGRVTPEVIIATDHLLDEDLGLDSLALVEVIIHLEDAYQLTIDDADAGKFRRVRDIVDYVRARQSSAAA